MNSISVRQSRPVDSEALVALQEACFPPEWHDTPDVITAWAASGRCLVAHLGIWIVGALLWIEGTESWELYSVEVDPAAQQHGVGKTLVKEFLSRVPKNVVVTGRIVSDAGYRLAANFQAIRWTDERPT